MTSKRPADRGGGRSEPIDSKQPQRFLEAAREAGCEENFDRFDDALRKIATAKPEPKTPPAQSKKAAPKG